MKGEIGISVEHSIMLDELSTMLGLDTREEVAAFMLAGTIDYFYHKVKSDTALQASGKVVTGSGTGGAVKGFLKPQEGSR